MNLNLYGLLGVGYYKHITKIKSDALGIPIDETLEIKETGPSFGVGIDLFGSPNTAISLTWMKLIDEEADNGNKLNISSLYLGITHYFTSQRTNHWKYRNF